MIFFNRYFDKNRLKALVLWSLTKSGEKTTIDLVETLKDIGFHYATQAGLSLSIDDLKIPPNKAELILESENIVQSSQQDFEIGNLTIIERFQQMIDTWHRTSEVLKQNVVQHFRSTDILNPVYMMAFSGARGNISQVRQLVGMRGLMADPQGQILDFPIRSNFREGLTLTEYVISCYGARKGLVDTALRTANSGYLTRRLVDVAQHIIVRQLDCGTKNGILVTDMKDGKKIILSVQKRIVGRVLAESVNPIAFKNQDISPSLAAKLVKLKKQILVRSPLTCEAKNSVCQLCYGWSLAHGNLVSLGEAVGILAAQSIGEPGTQLTMRTFHTGGVFSGDVMQEIRSPIDANIYFSFPLQGSLIRTLHGKIAFLTKMEGEFCLRNEKDSIKKSYQIPSSSILFVKQFEYVYEKQLLVEYSSFVNTKNQGIQAKYNLNSDKEGQIYFEDVLLVVKAGKEGDIIKTSLKFGSIWILAGKLYEPSIRSTLFTKAGDLIDTNSILNESIFATPYRGFVELFQKTKSKKTLLTKRQLKNVSLKTEINYLTQILNTNSYLSNQRKTYLSKNIQNDETQLHLKQPFAKIFFTNLYLKKFGYFFKINNFKNVTFFFSNELTNSSIQINKVSLQIFDNKNLKNSGIFYFDKEKVKDQKGQFFLVPEKFYKISDNSIKIKTKFFFKNVYITKEKNLIRLNNLQNDSKHIISPKKQFLFLHGSIIENQKKETRKKNFDYRNKKILLFKENPYRNSLFSLKKSLNIIEKKSLLEKTLINTKYNNFSKKYIFPIKNRTKNYQYRKENNLTKISNFTQTFDLTNKVKFKKLYLRFESGWVMLPKKKLTIFLSHSKFYRPGTSKNIFKSDQIYSMTKIIAFEKNLTFFQKNRNLKMIRFLNNKKFRLNRTHHQTNFLRQSEAFLFNKKITRNLISLTNKNLQTKFLVLMKKEGEINSLNKFTKRKLLQNLSNNLYSLMFYNNSLFLFNKQNITRLKSPFPSIDIKINSQKIEKNLKSKTPTVTVSFVLPKQSSLKQSKIELLFPRTLQISVIQQINTANSLISDKLSTEKLLLTKEKAIFEKTSLVLNSFSSPLIGEITNTKLDSLGKQKSLLLTNKNQLSFTNPKNDSLVKIGQLLRYGDKLTKNIAIQDSGQIIEIDNNKITLRKAQPILFSSQGVFHVDNGDLVEKNAPLITLFYRKLKTEDIVQGIPKIEELFEARQTKEGETLQENLHTKLQFFFNFYKQNNTSQEAVRKSIQKIQQILVNNVQKVYQSQGVTISDKHIEIIVRQMTTKVKITESGRTGLLRGELIDLEWVELINLGIEAQNEMIKNGIELEKAEYEPIILGITKAALETESFISASSFQETTRILSRAAIERKTDFLRGLKENVILGHLIPAGTGFSLSFDPQLKISNPPKKLSWLSYKEIVRMFSL